MNKEGISTPSTTMAMMLQLCGVQISVLLVGIFCVIINPSILSGGMVWLFRAIICTSCFYIMVCSIPLPGSIGVSESVFLKLFGGIFGELVLSSAMLINRFVSFYFFVLVSTIVVVINAIKTKDIKSKIDKDIEYIDG